MEAYKDGKCDVSCNTAECNYDGGDCLPSCPQKDECVQLIGDGRCSSECNTQECPYDHLDCEGTTDFVSSPTDF